MPVRALRSLRCQRLDAKASFQERKAAGVEALDVLLEFADHEEAAVESGVPGDFDGVCVVKSVLEYKSGRRPPPDRGTHVGAAPSDVSAKSLCARLRVRVCCRFCPLATLQEQRRWSLPLRS